jgi:uncharacterized membrane protein YgcG
MRLGIWLAALLFPALASGEQPKPMPGTFVHDFAGVIQVDKKAEIQAKAQQLKDHYKTEIAVVTVDSLEGEKSFDYSLRMARSWGIGSKDDEVRGLLILVAVKDRQTAFRTSRHIEGELPDGVTGDIRREMNLHFKDGDFGGGLSLAMSRILERLEKVYEAPERQQAESGSALVWLWVLLGSTTFGAIALLLVRRSRRQAREVERKRALTVAETRRNYFTPEKPTSRQTGQQTRQQKAEKQLRKQEKKRAMKSWRDSSVGHGYSSEPAYSSSSSGSDSSSTSSSSSTDTDYGSSSYDSGSSSGSDSGSSYSGGSDFGGGGSDSSW